MSSIRYVPLGNGKICEVKVETDDRNSPWLEVRSRVTKKYKFFTPPSVGDQAFVFNPNGVDNEEAYAEIGVSYESVVLPVSINEDELGVWTSDGTSYIHNIKNRKITLTTPCEIFIDAKKMTVKAEDIKFDGEVEITKDLKVGGDIEDSKGDVTNHTHVVQKHALAKPRE